MVAPDVGTGQPGMVGPQMMYPSNPSPQEAQAWSHIDNVIGDTPSKFIQMLGKTPEERQANAKIFADTMEKVNGAVSNLAKSTLGQRLAEEKIRADRMRIAQSGSGLAPVSIPSTISQSDVMALLENTAATQAAIGSRSRWQR